MPHSGITTGGRGGDEWVGRRHLLDERVARGTTSKGMMREGNDEKHPHYI